MNFGLNFFPSFRAADLSAAEYFDQVLSLSAIAARTRRVRLITGAVIPAFNHPVKLAGELAMLDNLCTAGSTWASGARSSRRSSRRSACAWTRAAPASRRVSRSCSGCGPRTV